MLFKAIHVEGQGVWTISIYSMIGVVEAMIGTLAGNADADRFMRSLEHLVQELVEASRTTKPMLCLLCDNSFRESFMPAAWVLLQAHRDTPTLVMGNGVCWDCWCRYPSVMELAPVVTDFYRRKVITDLRVLPPLSEPGSA